MHHNLLELPLRDPVILFTAVLFVILVAPIAFKKIRIPSIIGLIFAGTVLGPNGFGILERDEAIVLFGSVGLHYIMFLAGLEIDLNDFKKNRNKSFIFGGLTFFIPMILGTVVAHYFLEFSLTSSVLLASMFASHTLLAYPAVSKLGITKSRSVNITVGGTMITDTAALLVLAVIAGSARGELSPQFWVQLGVSFAIFTAIVILAFPVVARWFFKTVDDPVFHYIFVLAMVFLAASLAELAGVEAIIGAFFGGLALNRLIPHTSPLMNRIEFVGNALFIPFFLLSVGMLVDVEVLTRGPQALIVAATMLVIALLAKFLAALAAQKIFGFSAIERQVIFGLSSAQAAATLAAVLVGYQLEILNDDVLNGTIVMILGTCLASSLVVEKSGRELAILEADAPIDVNEIEDRILVPISNPGTIENLVDMAIMSRPPGNLSPIYALAVVRDSDEVAERLASTRKMLEKALKYATGADQDLQIVPRVDVNVSNGILRAARDLQTNQILMGWNAKVSAKEKLFGSVLDVLLDEGSQMILVSRMLQPLNTVNRIVLAVPPVAEKEPGFLHWLRTLKRLAKGLGCNMKVFVTEAGAAEFQSAMTATSPEVEYACEHFDDWNDFLALSRHLKKDDLFVVVSARPGTISYEKIHASIPTFLSKYHQEDNFLVVYPELGEGLSSHKGTNR